MPTRRPSTSSSRGRGAGRRRRCCIKPTGAARRTGSTRRLGRSSGALRPPAQDHAVDSGARPVRERHLRSGDGRLRAQGRRAERRRGLRAGVSGADHARPEREKDAGALNLANGYLYAATLGYIGDGPPYQGHVVSVQLSDGTTNVFNSLCSNVQMLLAPTQCSSERSGIWARAAVVVDPDASMDGRVYVTTGNGPFSPSEFDYGDSVIALSADGSMIEDSFTPSDYVQRAENDLDLGSTAPAMLPPVPNSSTPLLAVQGGKGRMFYLFNRARLGGVGGELQVVHLKGDLMTAPATWQDPSGRAWVFVGQPSGVRAFTVVTDNSFSQLQPVWDAHVHGTSPVVTNGLVFVASTGAVRALSAANGSVLWSSTDSGVGGTIGNIHWQSVVVADGAVYVSDLSGNLTAYALNGSRAHARRPKH